MFGCTAASHQFLTLGTATTQRTVFTVEALPGLVAVFKLLGKGQACESVVLNVSSGTVVVIGRASGPVLQKPSRLRLGIRSGSSRHRSLTRSRSHSLQRCSLKLCRGSVQLC